MKNNKAASTVPAALSALFTTPRANEGVRISLPTPTGEASGFFVTVRGLDSDAFQIARNEKIRRNVEILAMPAEEQAAAEMEAELALLSSLVAGWDLPEVPCTFENIVELLRNAPKIRQTIDQTAADRNAFFGQKPVA